MKLIIAGSRTLTVDVHSILQFIKDLIVTEVVSGGANGIDKCGEIFAKERGLPLTQFPANWTLHGRSAGHKRNYQMAVYADALLLIWDGKSKGSKGMKATMEKLGKPVYEVIA